MFDTNVLVSGYLWTGPARRALDKTPSGESTLLVSKESIEELIRILAYDKFGLKPDEIEPIIRHISERSDSTYVILNRVKNLSPFL